MGTTSRMAFWGWMVAFISALLLPLAWRGHLFPHASWLLTLTGVIGIILAFESKERDTTSASPHPRSHLHSRKARLASAALLVAAIALSTRAIWLLWKDPNAWHTPLKLWIAALSTMLIGGYIYGPFGTRLLAKEATPADGGAYIPPLPSWAEMALVGALLLLGVFLRIYRLNAIPPGIFVDETNAAGDALRILDGWPGSPFGVGWYETPLLYAYYLAGLFKLLGTTYISLKLASLIPALLTLVAFYFLARELFGPTTALTSLAFLVINRWHLTMSRWGWNELAPPLFLILTLYLLLLGDRKRNPGHFILAGVFMGLGMYTYLASRLAVVVVLLYIMYRCTVQRGYMRSNWKGVLLFLIAYSVTFAPLATTYAKNPFTFLNRSQQVSILNDMRAQYRAQHPLPPEVETLFSALHLPTDISPTPLKESVVKHARMFFFEGDFNPRHNIPGAPMLDPVTGVLFLFGFLYALWRWKDHRYGLLVIWVLVTMLGGVLSLVREAPQAYRTLTVVPAVCLLAGDMLTRAGFTLAEFFRKSSSESPQFTLGTRAALVFMSAVIVLSAYWNLSAFFGRWANDPRVWAAFTPMETAVAREVQAQIATHEIYLSPTLYWGSPVRFLTYRPPSQGGGLDHPPFKVIQPVEDLPLAQPVTENTLFILEPVYKDLIELFTAYYPHTRAELVTGPRGEPLYVRVRIPLSDVQAIRGVQATYISEDGLSMSRRETQIVHHWPEDFPQPTSVQLIRWQGSLFIPHSGFYNFRLKGGGSLELDGVPWREGQAQFLPKGLHEFTIQQTAADIAQQNQIAFQWQPEGREWENVPPHVLFTVSPPRRGLHGRYYRGTRWEGTPVFSRVDRTIFMAWIDPEPLSGPFSVSWEGWLAVPATGNYRLRIGADDGVRLWVDGESVGESLHPNSVNQVDVRLPLDEGLHTIRVDYFQQGGAKAIAFYWQPPGRPETIIPPSYLIPAVERSTSP